MDDKKEKSKEKVKRPQPKRDFKWRNERLKRRRRQQQPIKRP